MLTLHHLLFTAINSVLRYEKVNTRDVASTVFNYTSNVIVTHTLSTLLVKFDVSYF